MVNPPLHGTGRGGAGKEFGDAAGEFERLRDAELERRRIVQRLGLLGDR